MSELATDERTRREAMKIDNSIYPHLEKAASATNRRHAVTLLLSARPPSQGGDFILEVDYECNRTDR